LKKRNFKKRYLKTPKEFYHVLKNSSAYRKKIKNINQENKISPAFAEKIMLAVTGVTECVFCSYRHTKTALEKGIKLTEIQDILKSEFGNFSKEEQTGLLYAQHWAEKAGKPDMSVRERVIEYYGLQKTEYMEFYMHMVYMGNLISNTVEAYHDKFVPETGKVKFFILYLLCTPIAFFIKSGTKDVRKYYT